MKKEYFAMEKIPAARRRKGKSPRPEHRPGRFTMPFIKEILTTTLTHPKVTHTAFGSPEYRPSAPLVFPKAANGVLMPIGGINLPKT